MAKDDQNKDPEEDDFFGDDEDFGLPELDFDSLDDDDDDFDLGEDFSVDSDDLGDDDFDTDDDVFGDESEEKEEVKVEEPEPVAESSDELTDDGDDFNFDDFDEGGDEPVLEESGDDTDFDESDADFGDSEPDFSDSDFETEDDSLEDDEFKNFESDLMDEGDEDLGDFDVSEDFSEGSAIAENTATTGGEEGSKGKFAKIVIIGVVIFAVLGGLFYFLSPGIVGDKEEPIAEKVEKPKPKPAPAKKTPTKSSNASTSSADKASKPVPANQSKASSTSSKPANQAKSRPAKNTAVATKAGEVTSLTGRTNNFYVVIASFVDEDLALDHANKLAATGSSPTIIPPFGSAITTRVAIKGYGSLDQAQNEVASFKGTYGQDIWILKY